MNNWSDQELLGEYVERRAESAFTELVRRHIDLVYSAALRMVPDAHLAEDVTQGVFMALAENARRLKDHPVLAGWLHRTTQNLSASAVRSAVRRVAREQAAAAMNQSLANDPDPIWEQIAPHLDAALGELNEGDRDVLLLRYFQKKTAREIAQAIGTTEDAAQKRVNRAVDRLRDFFSKRGLSVGSAGLALVLSTNAVQSAPAGLSAALTGAAQAATIEITKAVTMTTIQKTLVTVVIAAGVGAAIYEAQQASHWQSKLQTLQQQHSPLAEQNQQLQEERDDALNRLAGLQQEMEMLRRDAADLPRLRGEITQLRSGAELARSKASGTDETTAMAAKSWISRVGQLKQRFEQDPSSRIPEMQFATEQDWLNAAREEFKSDVDYRRAASNLRSAAEVKVAKKIKTALAAYMKSNNNQPPSEMAQLQPYFDAPLDYAILERWQIASADTVKSIRVGGDTIITQKAAVDDVFDIRYGIGAESYGGTDFLSTQTSETMRPVWRAYQEAHQGARADNYSQLQPYATTPEQQAALQKLLLRESTSK